MSISSPIPGTFIISIHYKGMLSPTSAVEFFWILIYTLFLGRDKPILEIDLKLDDLLEKQQDHAQVLDLEYIKLDIPKTLNLLTKTFLSKSK